MKDIKVVIADDEPLMATELQTLLIELHSGIKIAGMAHDGETALQLIKRVNPDIVFLDIQMPEMSGIEVAAQLVNYKEPPIIVFATAYDEYALKAFTVNAFDYILKPYDEREIGRVIDKLNKRLAWSVVNRRTCAPRKIVSGGRKFSVEKGDRVRVVDIDEIEIIYAKDRLVYLKTLDGGVYRTKLTLQEYEAKLPPETFFRCHRNYIVNVNQIKEIANWFNKGYILILGKSASGHKHEIPVGRAYAAKLKEYIEL